MRVTKLYNNLHEKTVPKLKRGEIAIFKLLGIKPDPNNEGRLLIPAGVSIPNVDTIYDPNKGEYVDIACISSVGVDGNAQLLDIWFRKESGGAIMCNGNNRIDQELYGYLMLSNRRSNNEHKANDAEPVYELIDTKSVAQKVRGERSKKLEAMTVAAQMSSEDVVETVASLGLNEKQDLELLREKLEAMAENDPESFLKVASNSNKTIKANVKRAIDQGVIIFDKAQNAFKWALNEEIIATIPRSTGSGHLDGFAGFLISNKKGEKIYEELTKLLK
jgi:hypothetical protein